MPSEDCRIGVVVITHNRREELLHTLDHLAALAERPPIVVVDNASSDDTCTAVSDRYPEVVLLPQTRNLGAAARTVGVQRIETEYVALCDDDCRWEQGSLRLAADLFDRHPRLGLLNARVLVGPEGELDPTCRAMADSPLGCEDGLPGPLLLGFLAGAAAVRRSAFLECGGFDARWFLGGEEQLLAADLASRGWRLCYVPQLVVRHFPSPLRNARDRRRYELRNALWFAWLRRPWPQAVQKSFQLIRKAPPRIALEAVALAAAGWPQLSRSRRVVSDEVERGLCQLEAWHAACQPTTDEQSLESGQGALSPVVPES